MYKIKPGETMGFNDIYFSKSLTLYNGNVPTGEAIQLHNPTEALIKPNVHTKAILKDPVRVIVSIHGKMEETTAIPIFFFGHLSYYYALERDVICNKKKVA